MPTDSPSSLRLRKKTSKETQRAAPDALAKDGVDKEDVVWGKTPSGEGMFIASCIFNEFSDAFYSSLPRTYHA